MKSAEPQLDPSKVEEVPPAEVSQVADQGLDPSRNKKEGKVSLSQRLRQGLRRLLMHLKSRAISFAYKSIIFLKTRPKEFALYVVAMLKVFVGRLQSFFKILRASTRAQKLTFVVFVLTILAGTWILRANLKGVWLPQFQEPVLTNFADHAESVDTYDPKEPGLSFYQAFPQERHEFLFKKFKVNLKRTQENPLPMGAFELIVLLDSEDAAVEVRDREIELHDFIQRVFEDETFADLEQEIGKARFKSRLQRELNQKLTRGWVREVILKTFILKP